MKTLHLTSPQMHGQYVESVQQRLGGMNKWKKNFHPGNVDGHYGEQTAAATYRAKYFLGYPKRSLNKSFGPRLRMYLNGKEPLPASYIFRMKRRKRLSAKRKALRLRALYHAKRKIGLAENPQGSNKNWLVAWWYKNKNAAAPWCNISVSHSYLKAGSKAFKRGVNWAYVPAMEAAARSGDMGLMRVKISDAKPGDIVTFNFDGGVADHTGMCEHPGDPMGCIEGNTDAAGGAEGGEQMRKVRDDSVISMVIRVLK